MRIALVLIFIKVFYSFGQIEKVKNYSKYNTKSVHFGLLIGANISGFTLYQKLNAYEDYGLVALNSVPAAGGGSSSKYSPGLEIGTTVSVNLGTPLVRLRLMPHFSFQERVLNYVFKPLDGETKEIIKQQRIRTPYFNFPLTMQLHTLRLNNFGGYFFTGAQFSLNTRGQQKDIQNADIRLKGHDWQGQLGFGAEFFLRLFKLGMEIKYSHGLGNSLIQDNTLLAEPIDRLYNKVWSLSLIFEK